MFIFLYGADTYRSRKKLSALKEKFIKQQNENKLTVSSIDAVGLDINELRKIILSRGLFSKKRLIIIEKLLTEKNRKKKDQTDAIVDETINILKRVPSVMPSDKAGNIIIFWDEEIKEKELTSLQKKLYQILKKQKYYQEFKLLKPFELRNWINKEVEKNKTKIEQEAVNFLIDIYGSNLYAIKNELDKLMAGQYASRSIIDLQELKNNVMSYAEQNIWRLTDAVGQKNKKLAIRLLSDQIRSGSSIDYLISMLAHQYRIILRIKSYLNNQKIISGNERETSFISPYQLSKKLSLHIFVCQKGIQQEKNYTLEELKKIYGQLLDIDLLRKTRPINPEILLDLLILKN